MSNEDPDPQFEGFRKPTYTMVPDEVFDELLADLTGAELKVLLYICRRTFGFKKDSDNISLNQMLHGITKKDGTEMDKGAGVSKPTLLRALRSLSEKNIIVTEQRESEEKGNEPTNYMLNFLTPLGKKMTQGGSQNLTKPLVKKSTPQQTDNNRQLDNTVNGKKSLVKKLPDLEQPQEKTAYVAQHILDELGDTQSEDYYNLVAAKVPEDVIRRAIAEIEQDGAKHPPAVFTHRMEKYALDQLKKQI